jgi:hypothetical protein
MKKYAFVIALVLLAIFASGVIAEGENAVFIPMVFGGPIVEPATETPTPTEPLTPADTPTPTQEYVDGYNWVFVGRAGNIDDTLTIYGVSPGYCFDIQYLKEEKTIYLEAAKIPIDECDRGGYNPDAEWPPPEYPPPAYLPPDFAYGDTFKLVLDINAKVVCSVYWPENCVAVP